MTNTRRCGGAIREAAPASWPAAVAAAHFLALTGWRRGEALGLRWGDVDLARRTVTLPDTKTGRSIRPLPNAACDVLRSLPRTGELVFPATRGDGRMTGFPKLWAKMARAGALPADVTPHVLRHSFASLAADLGYSEPTIAALVGHKGRSITSRYVHAADAVLLAASDAVADRTAELMGYGRRVGRGGRAQDDARGPPMIKRNKRIPYRRELAWISHAREKISPLIGISEVLIRQLAWIFLHAREKISHRRNFRVYQTISGEKL